MQSLGHADERIRTTSAERVLVAMLVCAAVAGCAAAGREPLPEQPSLASSVSQLDRYRTDGLAIPAQAALTPAEVAILAVQNSPDLRAARAKRGVAQAQVFEAGLLADPVLAGSYNVLLAGPGIANAIGATLTGEITALIIRPARQAAARRAAMQVDADLVWQELQTISQAQTFAVDLVKQQSMLDSLRRTLDLLRRREADTSRALRQGNATLQTAAPDVSAFTALQTQYQAAVLAQDQRWQSLDALLGLLPSVRLQLATDLQIPEISSADAASLLASLPMRRPDLIALQLGYAAQNATVRAAVLGQFPALTLGPNYGNDTSRVQSLGPAASITLPLFNRNRGQIALQKATRVQLRQEYAARLDAADGGARALLANLDRVGRQLADSRGGLRQSRALSAAAEKAQRSALIDERTYVDLIVAALEKERQVIGLEQQVLDDRIALATLLAAGLPVVPLDQMKDLQDP